MFLIEKTRWILSQEYIVEKMPNILSHNFDNPHCVEYITPTQFIEIAKIILFSGVQYVVQHNSSICSVIVNVLVYSFLHKKQVLFQT